MLSIPTPKEDAGSSPGEYTGKVISALETISKPKFDGEGNQVGENPMLKLEVAVSGFSRPFTSYVTFTDKAAYKVREFAKAMGLDTSGDQIQVSEESCIGRRCRVVLDHGNNINEKTGKGYLEIKEWLPAEEPQAALPEPQNYRQVLSVAHPRKKASNVITHEELADADEIPF